MNQKQTHRHELAGGYLWSPKRRSDGGRNQFYENMKEVAPGDRVFSYWDGQVRAFGTVTSFGYDAPKPEEFGEAGRNWSVIGYRADVRYFPLDHPLAPRDEWALIQPLLPSKYSPLNAANGRGLQSVYLAALPPALGGLIDQLLAARHNPLLAHDERGLLLASTEEIERARWEEQQVQRLTAESLAPTERDAIVKARRGQGLFRQKVALVEQQCRITKVSNPTYLIASHIKPWRHATNHERLSGDNGLFLAPQADFLFDRGFISFADGRVLVSPVADEESLRKLGLDPDRPPRVGPFSDEQEHFLEFHRTEIFRNASASRS